MAFWAMTRAGTPLPLANRSGDIFAPVEMEVCAGAHRLVVMKEGTSRGVHPKIETGKMVTVLNKENTCHERKRSRLSTERS